MLLIPIAGEEESPRELRRARSCDAVLTLGLVEQALQAVMEELSAEPPY